MHGSEQSKLNEHIQSLSPTYSTKKIYIAALPVDLIDLKCARETENTNLNAVDQQYYLHVAGPKLTQKPTQNSDLAPAADDDDNTALH